ncbi:MAG: AAA family ATPase, partial [Limnohabitans sp.]
KESVDKDQAPGRFLLTGSTNLMALPLVADSLAGRLEVITLLPFAQAELAASPGDLLDRLLHFEPIWGTELPRASGWLAAVRRDFDTIQAQGIQAAVSGLAT